MCDPALALVVDEPATRSAALALFPDVELRILKRTALHPRRPFHGALFELLAAQPREACLGLVLPIVPTRGGGACDRGRVTAIADHVNASLASPLAGRWPDHLPRVFPAMTGVYQPRIVRARGGAQVYSPGVVAGVADAARLTPFEVGVVRAQKCDAVSDMLIQVAVIAAYYGLTLAACGVPQENECDEE